MGRFSDVRDRARRAVTTSTGLQTLAGIYLGGGAAILGGIGNLAKAGLGPQVGLSGIGGALAGAGFYTMNRAGIDALMGGGIDTPDFPSSYNYESGSPTYSLTGKGNRRRIGEPVPVIYGHMRVYPDVIEPPAIHYNGTWDQLYKKMMAIGHGTFTLDNTTGDPMLGGSSVPVGSNVEIVTNRGSISTVGIQAWYLPVEGATGQTLTTSFTDAYADTRCPYATGNILCWVDVIFPAGLFDATSGTLANRSVTVEIEFKEYNGGTTYYTNTQQWTITAASRRSVRRTVYITVPSSSVVDGRRWKISVRRTGAESTSGNIVERCVFAGCRIERPAYATSGITICGLMVTASESVNGEVADKFSIGVTRKLPIWNGSTWSADTTTRSIAWALADILRNTTYGAGLSDDQIDLAQLLALDSTWSSRGDYCDCVFDQSVTIWEALERVARCGRAKPIIRNGQVTFVRDEAKSTIAAVFTPSHIKPNSLTISYSAAQEDDPDGIELSYIDTATWAQTKLTYQVGGGTPVRPRSVNFFGCTDSAQALREATYLARKDKYQRKTVQFTTEMDGHLITAGDLIVVAHDMPGWGQSGEVVGFTDNGATCDYLTSQAIDWSAVGTKYVLLRKPDGTVTGPHTATQITGGFRINDPGWVPLTDLSSGDRTAYLFGLTGAEGARLVVTAVVPRGTSTVQISAVPYDSRIHDTGA